MKKRNVMTMALSLAMVGVIGVGSTLAYLSAHDGTLTNTFEFDKSGITLDQWENANNTEGAELGAEGEVKEIGKVDGQNEDENGYDYTNVIPGGTYVIGSQNYILLRKVHPSTEAGERVLTLKAANAGYDSVRIAVDDVECVYRVVAQLRLC